MNAFTTLVIILLCVLSGCATSPTVDSQRRQLQSELREIVLDDGINASEADVIVQSYFLRFGPGCGTVSRVTDAGAFWAAEAAVGVGGIPAPDPIRVDKLTGRVTWSLGPVVENPKTIW